MLEITDELIKKIDKILSTGERNRNKILDLLISNDNELKKILTLYKKQKNEYDVMIKAKMPIETIRKSMENIYTLNRLIDKGIIKANEQRLLDKAKLNNKDDDDLEL